MSRRLSVVVAAVFALVRCDCSEPPNLQAGEGEGEDGAEGEGEEGEGEGDVGEGEGEVVDCVEVFVGDNVGDVVRAAFVARVAAIAGDRVVVENGVPAVACGAGSVAFVVGDHAERDAVLSDADVAAAGSEGYALKSGTVDGHPALVVDGNPADDGRRSPGGAAYGAWALLEELGYGFLHPLAPTVPPPLSTLPADLDVVTAPRWHVRNIHLHTMHPLELNELLNGWGVGDPDDVASWNAMRPEWSTYLEWILANGQNEIEWVLLEADSWSDFAQSAERQRRLKLLVDDCHAYGVRCGIDVPIALQQQHTFRMIRDAGDRAVEFAQIHERLDYLMAAGFDFLSTENGSTEFTNPGAENMLEWMNEVARYLDEEHDGTQALIKIHCSVGQTADPFTDANGAPLNFNFLPQEADARLGIMPHTVQMYSLTDPAPTYENTDFGYMRDFLEEQVGTREVVWHPETAYWVSVDIDVPLFLPLYAQRRVADLQLLADDEDLGLMGRGVHAGERMDGQSIFSSGWEWGYWLNDVVAARAAWDPFHGETTPEAAMQRILAPLARVLGASGPALVDDIADLAVAEGDVLIDGKVDGEDPRDDDGNVNVVRRNGFAYLAGFEAFDDIADAAGDVGVSINVTQPEKLGLVEMRNPLHEDPSYSGELELLLDEMSSMFTAADIEWENRLIAPQGQALFDELRDALHITRLRADQLVGLYDYVDNRGDNDPDGPPALAFARAALDEAAVVVARREAAYRVPVSRIASWRENPTAYNFTYLWTVHSLYFWWRDEGKAVDGPISPCYLNIIDPADIALGEGTVNDVTRVLRDLSENGFAEDLGECLAAPSEEPVFPQDDVRSRP